jgi:hypothetical protein
MLGRKLDRRRLEGHAVRGAVQRNDAGQVQRRLKTPWRGGTTHIVISPLDFMSAWRHWCRGCLPAANGSGGRNLTFKFTGSG